jgi:REP element-mobilizing transposase RayT
MLSGLHRTYGAHHLHFITCSCYRRLPFLRTARSRDTFLTILEQTRERYRFVVVGYVVMPEHIHLLLTEPEVGTPSTVMQVVKQRMTRACLSNTIFVVPAKYRDPEARKERGPQDDNPLFACIICIHHLHASFASILCIHLLHPSFASIIRV